MQRHRYKSLPGPKESNRDQTLMSIDREDDKHLDIYNFEAGGGPFFSGHHHPIYLSNSRAVTPVCLSHGSCFSRYAAMASSASLSVS